MQEADDSSTLGQLHRGTNRQSMNVTQLPNEIQDVIFSYLDFPSLKAAACSSSWGYHAAIPILWKDVQLVDCATEHHDNDEGTEFGKGWCYKDDHDDTAIINKLLIIARNPNIASSVQSITHRCHLPCPGIFTELPSLSFMSRNTSCDIRTLTILEKAIEQMNNVQNLTIIYGHWNLTLGLLQGFLAKKKSSKLRRLWLENVCLEGLPNSIVNRLATSRLHSVRLRRLHLKSFFGPNRSKNPTYKLTRGGTRKRMVNGHASRYITTVSHDYKNEDGDINGEGVDSQSDGLVISKRYDDRIYDKLPEATDVVGPLDDLDEDTHLLYGDLPPQQFMLGLLGSASQTLTSLNLDWLLYSTGPQVQKTVELFRDLGKLWFPNLKAFQIRNAVIKQTSLPDGIYLFDTSEDRNDSMLTFMERHQNLQCLAWPMDRFFSATDQEPEITMRAQQVIYELGRTLTTLRADAFYGDEIEPLTDHSTDQVGLDTMRRRRRFIEEFACHMTKVQTLKMEGGIPRDEKRETVRALARSPLERVVFIGVCCPIGNTWGRNSEHLEPIDPAQGALGLEAESESAIVSYTHRIPSLPSAAFSPSYGWGPGPPMIHTIAASHASSITELKFCGYNGSPILYHPTPITDALLHPLRYFHALEQLVLSMWLLTHFQHEYRDDSIVQFWTDASDPASTALALRAEDQPPQIAPSRIFQLFTGNDPDADLDAEVSWAQLLNTVYTPAALAEQVVRQVGPHLSPVAKARPGGVYVRISFCMGTDTADIFDLDVWIGFGEEGEQGGDKLLGWKRPRTEQDPERRKEKFEARSWF